MLGVLICGGLCTQNGSTNQFFETPCILQWGIGGCYNSVVLGVKGTFEGYSGNPTIICKPACCKEIAPGVKFPGTEAFPLVCDCGHTI